MRRLSTIIGLNTVVLQLRTWWTSRSGPWRHTGSFQMSREGLDGCSGSGVVDVVSVVDVHIIGADSGSGNNRRPLVKPLVHVAFSQLSLTFLLLLFTQFLLLLRLPFSQLPYSLGDCNKPMTPKLNDVFSVDHDQSVGLLHHSHTRITCKCRPTVKPCDSLLILAHSHGEGLRGASPKIILCSPLKKITNTILTAIFLRYA